MTARSEPVVVGWTEYVDLPDWGIRKLHAKIDTGARSSALHVENMRELPRNRIGFDVILHREKRDRRIRVHTRIIRRSRVRSSNGLTETRYFVATRLRLGPVERTIDISLVDRGRMLHRMLLGRSALSGTFLIDVDRRLVLSRKKRKKTRRRVHRGG